MRRVKSAQSLAKSIPLVEMGSHLTTNKSQAVPRACGRTHETIRLSSDVQCVDRAQGR
jgi:hypothetical protein